MRDDRTIPGRRVPAVNPADDRAQPGDVLGIERDGEVTYVGDDRDRCGVITLPSIVVMARAATHA